MLIMLLIWYFTLTDCFYQAVRGQTSLRLLLPSNRQNPAEVQNKYTQDPGRREDKVLTTDKIIHLIGGEIIGGAELHVLNLLSSLDDKHFTALLVCLTDGSFAGLAQKKGIFTASFPMRHPLDLTLLPALTGWLRKQNASLVHTHGSRANLLGRLSAKYLKIPCVSTYHSSLAHDYLSPWSARLALALDKLTLPLTAGIITVSEHLRKEVAARGGQNIRIIYNGYPSLDFSESAAQRQYFRNLWHIPDDAVVIGTIARLHPTKGHHYLIQAAARLKTALPNLHLLLIGDGPLAQELAAELQQKNLNYTMAGYLPQAYEALPAMDLFVMPSLSEGMGLVLLEAMQARLPVVASAAGGIPEIIRPGRDGLLVPAGESGALAEGCLSILENPLLAKALTTSAYQRWPQFSLAAMLAATQIFYEEILKTRNKT
jgi:glycosyltransferase involved in cell wall biosynthesis